MSEFYVKPGDSVSFAKTVGETDIYLFAGITGDFAVNHVNEQYMAKSKYGRRIAHGALLIGFASTCSSLMIEKCHGTAGDETPVSLGYDKVRFLGPVFIGDTLESHLHDRRDRSGQAALLQRDQGRQPAAASWWAWRATFWPGSRTRPEAGLHAPCVEPSGSAQAVAGCPASG